MFIMCVHIAVHNCRTQHSTEHSDNFLSYPPVTIAGTFPVTSSGARSPNVSDSLISLKPVNHFCMPILLHFFQLTD